MKQLSICHICTQHYRELLLTPAVVAASNLSSGGFTVLAQELLSRTGCS